MADDIERVRKQIIDLISAHSEYLYSAGWLYDIDQICWEQGGVWETIGRAHGWPVGYRGEHGWMSWEEAGISYGHDPGATR